MQTIVCLFLLFTESVAEDGDIYVHYNINNYENNLSPTNTITGKPFEFGHHSNQSLNMYIILKNKPEGVTAALQLLFPNGVNMVNLKQDYFKIHHDLNESSMTIVLELTRHTGMKICNRKKIVRAYIAQDGSKYDDICLRTEPCVIVVDLSNNECSVPDNVVNTSLTPTDGATTPKGYINKSSKIERKIEDRISDKITTNTGTNNKVAEPSKPSHTSSKLLVFVIPSVVLMLVIILVVYMRVTKRCQRNSQPEATIELNTYATTNEIVYADLSLEHGNNIPPRPDETPYAQIIGVMKPVPSCKLRNK